MLIVSQKAGDPFGRQLTGVFACMLAARMHPHNTTYAMRPIDTNDKTQFGNFKSGNVGRSYKLMQALYTALHKDHWPTLQKKGDSYAFENGTAVNDVEMLRDCGSVIIPSCHADRERCFDTAETLISEWRQNLREFGAKGTFKTQQKHAKLLDRKDVIIHINPGLPVDADETLVDNALEVLKRVKWMKLCPIIGCTTNETKVAIISANSATLRALPLRRFTHTFPRMTSQVTIHVGIDPVVNFIVSAQANVNVLCPHCDIGLAAAMIGRSLILGPEKTPVGVDGKSVLPFSLPCPIKGNPTGKKINPKTKSFPWFWGPPPGKMVAFQQKNTYFKQAKCLVEDFQKLHRSRRRTQRRRSYEE